MDPSVVVVGSVNVDLVVQLPSLPSAGETVIGGTFSRSAGGKGGNQAVAAARLGARTWLVGLTGRDDLGQEARRDLEREGVDVSHLGETDEPTGVAAILVDNDGQNMIAVASGANARVGGRQTREAIAGIEVEHAVVLASQEVSMSAVHRAAGTAADRKWPVVLNAAPAKSIPQSVLAECDLLVANETEIEQLEGVSYLIDYVKGAVVVTRGADGAELHRHDHDVHHQPGFPIEAVDSTGAGDAFVATVAWALADGRDLEEAVRLATAAGALACRRVGARAALPDRPELERFAEPGPKG